MSIALCLGAILAMAALASPAQALSCPDETGHSSSNPADVTYFLTASACTKTDPGAGVMMTAHVQDLSATVTFLRPGSSDPVVSTSFTTGLGCISSGTPTGANVAGYKFGTVANCTTTVRLDNGAEFSFRTLNDSDGYAESLTGVSFSVPATTTTVTSSLNPSSLGQEVTFTAEVLGGAGGPNTGVVDFNDGMTMLASILLSNIGAGLPVVSIASGVDVGGDHACGLTAAGGVKCWGQNSDGQLGNGGTAPISTPDDVSGLTGGVVAIAVGTTHSCALTAAGGVKCWGDNFFGQLGNNSNTPSNVPVDVAGLTSGAVAIAAGSLHSCALTEAGGVKCWGRNSIGQLGNNSNTNSIVPVDVSGLASGVGAISSGGNRTCAIIAATGGAKCWGNNFYGGIGDNSTDNRNVPTDVSNMASGVAMISVGNDHTCAVTTAGRAFCWGRNIFGQLGNGVVATEELVPVAVNGLESGVSTIAAGRDHTCALMTAGGAKCWGRNFFGQLGDGTADNRSEPRDVPSLTSGVKAILAGNGSTYAVTTGAGAKSWGRNDFGRLGDGTTDNRSTPVNVFGLQAGRSITSFTTLALGVGNHDITGTYVGDGNRTGSTSPVLSQTVNKAATSTSVSAIPPPPRTFGQEVILTATVTSAGGTPGGTVNFIDGIAGSSLGTATLDGSGSAELRTFNLSAGQNTVGAAYEGDANFLASGGTAPYHVFTDLTSTSLTASPASPSTFGQSVTLTATVTGTLGAPGIGTVTFTDGVLIGATVLGTATLNGSGVATLSTSVLSAGPHTIGAAYGGSANFEPSSGTLAYTVNKAANVITFPALANTAFGTAPPVPAATASSGLAVTYASTTAAVCTATGAGVITFVSAGTCSITASQAGNANFVAATPVARSFSVTQGANAITFPALANAAFGTAPPVPAATASSGLPVSYASTTAAVCTATGAGVIAFVSAGTCSITASQAGNANFVAAASVARSFSVTQGANTITFPVLTNTVFGNIPPVPAATASSGLAVTYASTTAAVCTTTGAGVLTLVTVGTCSITAAQAGNANFVAATSVVRGFSVTQAATATTVASSLNPSAFGQSVSFTARVSATTGSAAPTGTVAITDTTTGTVLGAPALTPVTQARLSAGGSHACSVGSDGGVSCWGLNQNGQLGDGTTTPRSTPVPVSGLSSGVAAVAAGNRHSCALTTAGAVLCWGNNGNGQIGDGTVSTQRFTPTPVTGLSSGVTAIAAGRDHSCALKTTGALVCWGFNGNGQIGDGTTSNNRLTPVPVSDLSSGVASVSAGGDFSCAVTTAGAALCWGKNLNGRVGDGTQIDRLTPVPVSGLSSGVAAIAAGINAHSCAVTTAGAVKCWGINFSGQLGDSTLDDRFTPVAVPSLSSGVASVAVGGSFSCALTTTGAARCWGGNGVGQLGDGTIINRPTPVQVSGLSSGVAAIAPFNGGQSCARTTAGALRCWGLNDNGELGDGTITARLTPVATRHPGASLASVATSGLAVGAHAIRASYAGTVNFAASQSPLLTQTANKAPNAITFPALANTAFATAPPVPAATASSGLAVTYASTTAAVCTTTGAGVITLVSVGTCSITASQAGNANFLAATAVARSFSVTKGANVITFPVLANTAFSTAPPVPAATANSGLAVSYASTTAAVCTTTGAGVITIVTVGTCSITASQAGNANFLAATAVARSFSVTKGANVITFPALANTAFGTAPPVPAATASSGLAVSYASTTAAVCTVTGAGVTTLVSVGTCSITASQAGNANFLAATSVARSFSVTKGANIITFPALPNTAFGTAPPMPAATASSGLAVTYASTTSAVCTATGAGVITLVSAGTCSITASQPGNANFLAATSAARSFSVTKGANVITFPALANTAFGTAPPVPVATASSGLAVTYASTTAAVCTATGAGVITLVAVGTCSITASQAGNGDFLAAAAVSRSFSVTPAASSTGLATSGSPSVFGASVTFTATVSASVGGTPAGSVTFRDGAATLGVRTLSGGSATLETASLAVGTHNVTATYGGSTTHAGSVSAALTQVVNKAASTTTLTATPNPTLVNNAVTLRAAVAVSGATGNVAFRNGGTTIATVALTNGVATTLFTPTAAGTLPISAAYAGNQSFAASTSATLPLLAHASCTDAFAGALALAGGNGSVFGTTAGATGETGEPNHAGNSGALNSVWCQWTAPASGPVTFDTTGSGFDTTLAVYTGTAVNALTQVAANDNIAAGNMQSRVTFAATSGTVYRIAIDGVSATGIYVLNFAQAAAAPTTFAAVLPTARSITTDSTATAFATMINAGADTAAGCSIALPPGFPAAFRYQATNAANVPVGLPDTPRTIAPGAAQGFIVAVTPLIGLNSADLALVFDCANTPVTATTSGLNTLLLSSSPTPVPDLISIGATPTGDGILAIPGTSGSNAFGAAAINIGAAGTVTATIDDNGRGLALIARLCVSNPTTGACVNPATPAASATFTLATNGSATIAVFVTATAAVPFDPANNRLFLRFKTADGVTRGATSVAVRTQ